MAWLILLAAGLFETGFVVFLKVSQGFTKVGPTIVFAICAIVSFLLLSQAIRTIPVGTCYAVWTGIGAAGATIAGILWFGDPTNLARIFFVSLLIFSIVGLKFVNPE